METQFSNDLAYGQSIVDALEASGAYEEMFGPTRQETDLNVQKDEIDLWADVPYVGTVSIEQKSVKKIYNKLYFETCSCPRLDTPGWIYTSKADILLYFMSEQSHQVALVYNFKGLRSWWLQADKSKYVQHQNKTNNKTKGSLVPMQDIRNYLIKTVLLKDYKVYKTIF